MFQSCAACLIYIFCRDFLGCKWQRKKNPKGFKQKHNTLALITEKSEDRSRLKWSHWRTSHFLTSALLNAGSTFKHYCPLRSEDASSSSRPHSILFERSDYPFPRIPNKISPSFIDSVWIMCPSPNQLLPPKKKSHSFWLTWLSWVICPYLKPMVQSTPPSFYELGEELVISLKGTGLWFPVAELENGWRNSINYLNITLSLVF